MIDVAVKMLSACLYFFLLHLPLLLQLVHVDCLIYVETRISQGGLRGLVLKTPNNREFLAFLGIPYATPPVGQLRFKVIIIFNRYFLLLFVLYIYCSHCVTAFYTIPSMEYSIRFYQVQTMLSTV